MNSPLVPAAGSLLRTWIAPSVIVVFSGTVTIDFTSKPVVFASDAIPCGSSLWRKNSDWPVWMTLPTLPVPAGKRSASSFAAVSWNFFSFAASPLQSVGE